MSCWFQFGVGFMLKSLLLCLLPEYLRSCDFLHNCRAFSGTIREEKVNRSQTLGLLVLATSAMAARMIDSSFISRWYGITQWEHINHHFLWQPQCAALCLKKKGKKLFPHMSVFPCDRPQSIMLSDSTDGFTLFTQCVMKDHVTNYCC